MPLNTAIRGAQIEETTISGGHLIDATVPESKLDISNVPTDGYYLAWASGTSKMTWSNITGADLVVNEVPAGTVGGGNVTFTLANTPVIGSELVYLNGLLQKSGGGNDYTIIATTITFVTAPDAGDLLAVTYLKSQGFASFVSNPIGANLDTGGYSVVWSPAPGTNDTATGDTATMQVDSTVASVGQALYIASDGNFELANATASGTVPCSALALETGTGSKKVLFKGFIRHDAWSWTPGKIIYVDTTAGALTTTAPIGSTNQVQVVGVATHADRMYFNPQYGLVEVL